MAEELVIDDPTGRGGGDGPRPFVIVEMLDRLCPIYMSYGMSYADYWDGDNNAPKHYRELARMQVKERDVDAWRQGLYIYKALCCVYPLFNAFIKASPEPYMDHPMMYEAGPETAEDKADKDKQIATAWKSYLLSIMKQEEGGGDDGIRD